MTVKETKLVQAVAKGMKKADAYHAAGYKPQKNKESARVMAHQTLQKPHVKAALEAALAKQDITLDRALLPISKGLKAKKIVQVEGDFYETDVDDISVQLQASDRALKLMGVGQQQGSNLHLHLHKKAADYNL